MAIFRQQNEQFKRFLPLNRFRAELCLSLLTILKTCTVQRKKDRKINFGREEFTILKV